MGDTVTTGQVIARLGNSGDSSGPHLHYQLQDGPGLLRANSLPVTFTDLAPNANPSREAYFRAR